MTANPPTYFPPHYFAANYFGTGQGSVTPGDMVANLSGAATVQGVLTDNRAGWYGGGGIKLVGKKAPKPKRAAVIAAIAQVPAIERKSVDQVLNEIVVMLDNRIARKQSEINELRALIEQRKRQIDEEEVELLMWAA